MRFPEAGYTLRRTTAFVLDLLLALVLSQAALNLVGWPMPRWLVPFAFPLACVVHTTVAASFGVRARTLGMRATGLEIVRANRMRPDPLRLLVRAGALATLVLADWGTILSAARTPWSLGLLLLLGIGGTAVVLVASVIAQLTRGGFPHDALADARVVRLGHPEELPRPTGVQRAPGVAVATVAAAIVLAALRLVLLTQNSSSACREAEDAIASRFGDCTVLRVEGRVDVPTPGDTVRTVTTSLWMPLVVAPRPEREELLRMAEACGRRVAAQQGWRVDRWLVVQELEQFPVGLEARHDHTIGDDVELRFIIGGRLTVSDATLTLGAHFDYESVPI